jgi:hypothetical protein
MKKVIKTVIEWDFNHNPILTNTVVLGHNSFVRIAHVRATVWGDAREGQLIVGFYFNRPEVQGVRARDRKLAYLLLEAAQSVAFLNKPLPGEVHEIGDVLDWHLRFDLSARENNCARAIKCFEAILSTFGSQEKWQDIHPPQIVQETFYSSALGRTSYGAMLAAKTYRKRKGKPGQESEA